MKTLITTDPVDKAVYKFSNHPSILKIQDHCQNVGSFHFQKVTPDAVDREIRDLSPKKATGCPRKKVTDLITTCTKNLVRISRK